MIDGSVAIIGHGGGDPGISATLTRHLAQGITLSVVVRPGPRLVGRHQAPRRGVRPQRATGLTIGFTTVIRLSIVSASYGAGSSTMNVSKPTLR